MMPLGLMFLFGTLLAVVGIVARDTSDARGQEVPRAPIMWLEEVFSSRLVFAQIELRRLLHSMEMCG